ncbi:MAG: cytochrome d ubiquinol oxidase subunit II, partial [Stackebrandtia sp.]
VCLAGLAAAWLASRAGRDGWAFTFTAASTAAAAITLFAALYPRLLPSTLDPAYGLTVAGAASSPYTLRFMTVVAVVFTPLVLIYQGWTYWVFRKRLSAEPAVAEAGAGERRA